MNISILTPVWGARYISAFAEVGLPSLLTMGNLSSVCELDSVELVFLTSSLGRDIFENLEIIHNAKRSCSVRYVIIDDLISSANYGVTLTLAYARGMAVYGERQTSTAFIFFNSDFAVSDGSLSTVVRLLHEGHRCIIAPSLRVNAEAVFPVLSEFAAKHDWTLPMPSREMVGLALCHLHFTVIGRTLTQDFVHCIQHGQFYLGVDEDTLIGMHHLIFHIAIMPEKPLTTVNSYHDYCFVPEMIPSAQFTLIDDSDKFFMIEMQAQMQEKEMLRCGCADLKQVADDLSSWATIEHRRFARVPVVFHAKDVPPSATAARRAAQEFVDRIHTMLIDPPVEHAFHPFWTSGVAAWIETKTADEGGRLAIPPELSGQAAEAPRAQAENNQNLEVPRSPPKFGRKGRLEMQLRRLNATLFGVPIWHHRWRDTRAIDLLVGELGSRVYLLSCEDVGRCPPNVQVFQSIDGLLVAAAHEKGRERMMLHVLRRDIRSLRSMLSRLERASSPSRDIIIFVDHVDSELDPSNFSQELAQYTCDTMPDKWLRYDVSATFTGGPYRRILMRLERTLEHQFAASPSRVKCAVAALAWLALRVPVISMNVLGKRNSNPCPQYCSSAILRLRIMDRSLWQRCGPVGKQFR